MKKKPSRLGNDLSRVSLMVAFLLAGIGVPSNAHGADAPIDPTAPPPPQFDTNAPAKVVQPVQLNLSRELAEVVRLAQSGVEESVVVAYIEKTPPYHVGSEEIIYLQDLGVSDPIIKLLINRNGTSPPPPATPPPGTTAPLAPSPPAAVAQPPEPQPVAAPAAPPSTVAEFYEPLSPYGTWVEVAPYGWCWQPSVVTINAGWHPYCDNGYWLWSDSGWYWHSYYSWGWAPFHYGRWFYHPHQRWVWLPDRTWGPSWVSWRYTSDYCGWAPLPPGAHFAVGVGWSFSGRHVGPDFGFGLAPSHFTFVATAHFADHRIAAHSLPRQQVNVVYHNTTIVNNYTVGSNKQIINQGVDRRRIETVTKTRIPEVTVRELPHETQRSTMPGQISRVGKADVVYKPGPRIEVPHRALIPAAIPQRAVSAPGVPAGVPRRDQAPSHPREVPAPPVSKTIAPPAPTGVPNHGAPRAIEPSGAQPSQPSQPSQPAQPAQPPRVVVPNPPGHQRVAPPNAEPPGRYRSSNPRTKDDRRD